MGLFGKSFEEEVNSTLEKVRGQFPQARIAATVQDKVVTLTGEAPDMATKAAIMSVFNEHVKTDNTINAISLPAAAAAAHMPPPMTSASTASPAGAPFAGGPAAAGERVHEVVSGETLSAISKKYYGSANHYMKIFEANRNVLSNPDLIKPGQKLKIPS